MRGGVVHQLVFHFYSAGLMLRLFAECWPVRLRGNHVPLKYFSLDVFSPLKIVAVVSGCTQRVGGAAGLAVWVR